MDEKDMGYVANSSSQNNYFLKLYNFLTISSNGPYLTNLCFEEGGLNHVYIKKNTQGGASPPARAVLQWRRPLRRLPRGHQTLVRRNLSLIFSL